MQPVGENLRSYVECNTSAEGFAADVYTMGGTLLDGMYTVSKPGIVSVELHDGRAFIFSLSAIWRDQKRSEQQLSLFAA